MLIFPNQWRLADMSKSAKMKARLRASDRRRKRRGRQPTLGDDSGLHLRVDAGTDSPEIETDIAGLLANAALRIADRQRRIQDSSVIGGLRGLVAGVQPNGEGSRLVYQAMVCELDKAQIPTERRATAAKEFLEIAKEHSGSDRPDHLLQYLSLITA